MDRAIHRLEEYAWVAFTSVHGVRAIAHRVQALGRDARVFARCRIAAVGPATSRALRRLGISADLTPPTFTGAALTASIQQVCKGRIGRVLYPRSDIAGPFFGERIRAAGGTVDELIAYRTVECPAPSSATRALSEGVDAIVFASPSAVRNFLKQKLSIRNACIACIGPTTAKAARELGMSVAIVADEHTDEGRSDSIGSFFTRKGTAG